MIRTPWRIFVLARCTCWKLDWSGGTCVSSNVAKLKNIKANWLKITCQGYPWFHFAIDTRHRIAKFVFAGIGNSYRFGSWGTLQWNSCCVFGWICLFSFKMTSTYQLESWIARVMKLEVGFRDVRSLEAQEWHHSLKTYSRKLSTFFCGSTTFGMSGVSNP